MRTTEPHPLLQAYQAAVLARDADAFLALYAPDARVFDTWGVWCYEGVAARRAAIDGWFSSLGDERVQVTFEDVRVDTSPGADLALLSATGRFAAVSPAGAELRSMQNRLSWGLRRQGGGWRILHEHTSVPIGFGDLQGILQRAR